MHKSVTCKRNFKTTLLSDMQVPTTHNLVKMEINRLQRYQRNNRRTHRRSDGHTVKHRNR